VKLSRWCRHDVLSSSTDRGRGLVDGSMSYWFWSSAGVGIVISSIVSLLCRRYGVSRRTEYLMFGVALIILGAWWLLIQ
jgi:hypothetical protein